MSEVIVITVICNYTENEMRCVRIGLIQHVVYSN